MVWQNEKIIFFKILIIIEYELHLFCCYSLALLVQFFTILWVETINATNFLVNINPFQPNLDLHPSHLVGDKPDVSMLHIFGGPCYVYLGSHKNNWRTNPLLKFFWDMIVTPKVPKHNVTTPQKIIVSNDLKFDEYNFFFQKDPFVFSLVPIIVFPYLEPSFTTTTIIGTPLATTTLVPSTSLNLDPIVAFLHSLTCM
jgi:hypothetical protein